jgi:hypothetical protein
MIAGFIGQGVAVGGNVGQRCGVVLLAGDLYAPEESAGAAGFRDG